MNSCQRIAEMCKLFAENESNKRVRISFSNSEDEISVFVAFKTTEDWIRDKGTYILRQMVKQFKLDMVVYDPQSIFVKENYLFDMFGKQGHMLNYFIPFNFDKFSEKNLHSDDYSEYNKRYLFKDL